jgi:hypothetical protein
MMYAAPAVAQTAAVVPVSNLRFGTLLPGVPTRIPPADLSGAAKIQVTGKGRMTLVVVLPAFVTSPNGQNIPLQFSANDGQYMIGTGPMRAFDPRSPLTISVPAAQGKVELFVGGTAVPASTQAPGNYASLVSVQVFQ